MNLKVLIRGAAYLVFALALIATAIALNDKDYSPAGALQVQPSASTDSLDAELAHCKALGTEAANDAACKAVWQANRERFLNPKKLYSNRVTDPVPAAANQNQSTPGVGEQPSAGAPVPANRAGRPQ